MDNLMDKFVDCLRNNPNHAFDFICNNGYLFSKDELIRISKEILYAIGHDLSELEHEEILNEVAEELIY
jgi:hypothetical protein